ERLGGSATGGIPKTAAYRAPGGAPGAPCGGPPARPPSLKLGGGGEQPAIALATAGRRSTVAVLGLGAALLSPAFAPDRIQRAPRTQVVVPGGRGPGPPGAKGYEPPPQDATPPSAFRMSPDDAPNERGRQTP